MQNLLKMMVVMAFAFATAGRLVADDETLATQPTPFTVLLDFAALKNPFAPKQSLPIWVERVQVIHSDGKDTLAPAVSGTAVPVPHTTYRLRLRSMPGLNDSILLRVFFEDRQNARPTVTGWSETGDQRFDARILGAGLELPASESMVLATKGLDYLEIDVDGDGSTVTKAFLSTLKSSQISSAFDFSGPDSLADPFGCVVSGSAANSDSILFGRVRATLDAGTIKLAPPAQSGTDSTDPSRVQFEFNLESQPLLALVTFDVLNADPAAPLTAWSGDQNLGPVSIQLPDLADPAYAGIVRPFENMRFHYTGWVRCQKVIPGSALRAGLNRFTLQVPGEASPVAIRAVELQLKHSWGKLDYTLAP